MDVADGSVWDVMVLLLLGAITVTAVWMILFKAASLHPRMRLRHSLIVLLAIGAALFVLIPESREVAEFEWQMAFPEYVESDGGTALVSYALVVSPLAYLPYMWVVAALIGIVAYFVRARRTDTP